MKINSDESRLKRETEKRTKQQKRTKENKKKVPGDEKSEYFRKPYVLKKDEGVNQGYSGEEGEEAIWK